MVAVTLKVYKHEVEDLWKSDLRQWRVEGWLAGMIATVWWLGLLSNSHKNEHAKKENLVHSVCMRGAM
jgi:hypothetical protein